jgi:hypothetical protein
VGILKQWLVKALSTALRRGDATISLPILESYALSAVQCDKIAGSADHLGAGPSWQNWLWVQIGDSRD